MAARHGVNGERHHSASGKKRGLLQQRCPKRARLVGQRAAGAEYLYQGNKAEEEINNPNDAVALEYRCKFLHSGAKA